jgi:hypothetical protein
MHLSLHVAFQGLRGTRRKPFNAGIDIGNGFSWPDSFLEEWGICRTDSAMQANIKYWVVRYIKNVKTINGGASTRALELPVM